jgi:murein DD-endopeptidase MepM/ murein hydrolase activator NlpD
MKISYISLKKKFNEYTKNKKNDMKNKKEKNSDEEETKFIGINYSKKENKKGSNMFKNFKAAPKGSYTLMIAMFLLLAITTKVNMNTYSKINKENYDTYILNEENVPASKTNVIIYQEAASSVYEINDNYDEQTLQTTSSNILQTNKDVLEEERYVYEYSYIRPVEGETLKEYSMDKVIYSKTLDMWKVHDGIDIHANIGDEVKAAEAGIVERVYKDSFYGFSVIIDHQNGIKTIYRNLDNEILVKEKESVERGKVIARVGNTASGECKDETHIHFEVVQNCQIVNPSIIGIK